MEAFLDSKALELIVKNALKIRPAELAFDAKFRQLLARTLHCKDIQAASVSRPVRELIDSLNAVHVANEDDEVRCDVI